MISVAEIRTSGGSVAALPAPGLAWGATHQTCSREVGSLVLSRSLYCGKLGLLHWEGPEYVGCTGFQEQSAPVFPAFPEARDAESMIRHRNRVPSFKQVHRDVWLCREPDRPRGRNKVHGGR